MSIRNSLLILIAFWALAVPTITRGGSLELSVVDESGAQLPCRVLVKSTEDVCFTPESATTIRTGRDNWFISAGHTTIEVPAGKLLLRVEHGLEFVRFKEHVDIPEAGVKKTVRLRRWGLQMLGQFSAFAAENAGPEFRSAILSSVEEATSILQRRLKSLERE